MKRLLVGAFLLYVAIAIVLVILDHPTVEEVVILAFPRQWTQYLDDEEETLTLTLFFSSTDTFLCDDSQIVSVTLTNEDSVVSMALFKMQKDSTAIVYEDIVYSPIELHLIPDIVSTTGLVMDLQDAILTLSYQNGDQMAIHVGDIAWVYPDDTMDSPLSLSRLYGLFDSETSQMTGVVLGLSSESNLLVTLTSFTIGSTQASIDIEAIIPLDQDYRSVEELEEYAVSSGYVSSEVWEFEEEVLLYLPLNVSDSTMLLYRFPLFITCMAFGVEYRFVIDDFLFRSCAAFEPEYDHYAEKTIYRY